MAWLLLPTHRWLALSREEDVCTEVRAQLEDSVDCLHTLQVSRRRSAALICESRLQSLELRRAGLLGRLAGL